MSCWTGAVFMLVALCYVDDTELLLRIQNLEQSDAEFFAQIQRAVMAWGKIVQVTGGCYLKQEKCYASVNSFRFVNVRAVLKTKNQLPKTQLFVPQPNDEPVPIMVIDPTE